MSCVCGKPSAYRTFEQCRACNQAEYRRRRQTAGGGLLREQDGFDWVKIERAWDGDPIGGTLTRAERAWLTAAHTASEWTPASLARVLRVEPPAAEKWAADIQSGRIPVPSPSWFGA